MSTATDLTRLRHLRVAIDNAQARVKKFSDMRDELIADMLIEHAATGEVIGAAAGVSQPRTTQIRHAVVARREMARAATRSKSRKRTLRIAEAS